MLGAPEKVAYLAIKIRIDLALRETRLNILFSRTLPTKNTLQIMLNKR